MPNRPQTDPLSDSLADFSEATICDNDILISQIMAKRLCCANPVRDSSRESSMVAGVHEQTHISDLQDHELASL